jgi:hypothetical protein
LSDPVVSVNGRAAQAFARDLERNPEAHLPIGDHLVNVWEQRDALRRMAPQISAQQARAEDLRLFDVRAVSARNAEVK